VSVRVLVVEDEFMIGLDIGEQLGEAGFEVVGPALSVTKALQLVAEPGCDVAVLDINLGGETSGPIARKLQASGTPFVVVTGYSVDNLPPWFHDEIIVTKPYRIADLVSALRKCADVMPNTSEAVGRWLLLDEKLEQAGDDSSSPIQVSRRQHHTASRGLRGALGQRALLMIMLATILLLIIMAWHGRGRWY
jgi:DNA-binding NarL/FixJ family response regulator